MPSEKMWAIVSYVGLYYGTWHSRREAIIGHVRDIYGETDPYQKAWKRCRNRGDRAVRVTVTWAEKKGGGK